MSKPRPSNGVKKEVASMFKNIVFTNTVKWDGGKKAILSSIRPDIRVLDKTQERKILPDFLFGGNGNPSPAGDQNGRSSSMN